MLEILYDRDAATLKLYKGGVLSYTVTSVPTTANVFSAVANEGGTAVWTLDFGQNGYVATDADYLNLSTANLPTPAIINPADHFCSVVIDHDGSDTDGTCTFNLDTYEWLAIIKNTTGAAEKWYWINSLDGVNKYLDQAGSALVTDANVMSVSGTTFTLGSTLGDKDYLVEFHKAGLASATAANTSGTENTIATSENATSGFGMAQFAAPSSGNFSIGHGFSVALSYVVTNETSRASSWLNWHTSLNGGSPGTTYRLNQNATTGQTSTANYWGSTGMTSTVMGYGTAVSLAASENVTVFYWHGVDGYSAFGSYEGNGVDAGPFINMNMSPRTIISKNIDNGGQNWALLTATLSTYNLREDKLSPNALHNLATLATSDDYHIYSNGYSLEYTNGMMNVNGETNIYAAWGGTPIQGDGSTNQGRAK